MGSKSMQLWQGNLEDLELLSCASDLSLSNTPKTCDFVHRLGGCHAAHEDAEHPAAVSPSRGAHSGGKGRRDGYLGGMIGMVKPIE